MNLLMSLFVIATVASAAEKEIFNIPIPLVTQLHNIAIPCAEKYNVDFSVIRLLGGPSLPRDDATNNFLVCYAENAGVIDEDGHMVADKIVGFLGNHPKTEKVREVLNKCNEDTMDSKLATTVAMHICYTTNSPVIYAF